LKLILLMLLLNNNNTILEHRIMMFSEKPVMSINNTEKSAIKAYFSAAIPIIQTQLNQQKLPNGTKITRPRLSPEKFRAFYDQKMAEYERIQSQILKRNATIKSLRDIPSDDEDDSTDNKMTLNLEPKRYYLLPGDDQKYHVIPVPNIPSLNDPEEHSATWINEEIYIHQNRDDCNFAEKKDEDEEDYLRYLKKESYQNDQVKFVVKYAVAINREEQLVIFKSKQLPYPLDNEINQQKIYDRSYELVPELHQAPPFIRIFERPNGATVIKRIDVLLYQGESLASFLNKNEDLDTLEKSHIAEALLEQYIHQIYKKSIIHTDINANNICIRQKHKNTDDFIVTFIDFEQAFLITDSIDCKHGLGTPGYLAPELFKTIHDYNNQTAYIDNQVRDMLHPEYSKLFSVETDIYALSCVLLFDLNLQKDSSFYHLAKAMHDTDPKQRPSVDNIKQSLNHHALEPTSSIAALNQFGVFQEPNRALTVTESNESIKYEKK